MHEAVSLSLFLFLSLYPFVCVFVCVCACWRFLINFCKTSATCFLLCMFVSISREKFQKTLKTQKYANQIPNKTLLGNIRDTWTSIQNKDNQNHAHTSWVVNPFTPIKHNLFSTYRSKSYTAHCHTSILTSTYFSNALASSSPFLSTFTLICACMRCMLRTCENHGSGGMRMCMTHE